MTATPGTVSRILRYARHAAPTPIRSALAPLVRRVVPVEVMDTAQKPDLTVCDVPAGNPWTVLDRGRKTRFFFLCGCYKSGTNWVQNILNLHPRVNVVGEFHFDVLMKTVKHFTTVDWFISSQGQLRDVGVEGAEALVRRMMYAGTRDKPGATWLGDRTPSALGPPLRGAPSIVITRDGRDVVTSWSFHHLRLKKPESMAEQFRAKAAEVWPRFQADPDGFNPLDGFLGDEGWLRFHARQWAETVRASREALPRLREAGAPVHEIRYEAMHEDLAPQIDRLYRFLGLDPAEAAPPSLETKTLPGFERPENRKSFFRKGEVGDWRNYLDDRTKRIFKEEAGVELIAAGYETDLDW